MILLKKYKIKFKMILKNGDASNFGYAYTQTREGKLAYLSNANEYIFDSLKTIALYSKLDERYQNFMKTGVITLWEIHILDTTDNDKEISIKQLWKIARKDLKSIKPANIKESIIGTKYTYENISHILELKEYMDHSRDMYSYVNTETNYLEATKIFTEMIITIFHNITKPTTRTIKNYLIASV